VNLAAIDIWESKHPPKPNTKSSKSRRRGRKGRHLKHSRNCTISDTVVENQDRETQHISETPPVRPDERLLQNQNKPQESAKSQSPFANDPNPPETSAQILHRSNSLKRAFCTSSESFTPVSIGLTTPSHHSTPQLEESSRELDTSLAFVTQEDGIIPDSQSLPGSSSYVPTSNTSTSGSATQKSRISVPSNFVSPVLTNIQGRDSAESSSNFEVAASQLSLSSSQRSQSAPPSSSAARLSTPPCGAHLPLLVRTSSDPSPANTFKQDQQSPEHRYPTTRYNRPSKRTADSRFTLLASSKQRPRSPEIQIPGSVTRSSEQSSSADTYRLDHSLVIQTQDPLASPKQGERIIQTPVGKSIPGDKVRVVCLWFMNLTDRRILAGWTRDRKYRSTALPDILSK